MEKKDEKVAQGKFVAYDYKLYNADNGELLFEVPEKAPDTMIAGVTQDVVPGLAAALDGLKAGDKFEVELPAEAAFGARSEEWISYLDKKIFTTPDGNVIDELKVGARLPMMTDRGFMIQGLVTEITDDKVTMDFNHPFAGLNVRYDGKVIEVRDATEDELHPKGGCCGCGSHGCGDGDCGGGDCGSGCGGGCH